MTIKPWHERIKEWLANGRTNVIYPHHREAAMLEEIAELRAQVVILEYRNKLLDNYCTEYFKNMKALIDENDRLRDS